MRLVVERGKSARGCLVAPRQTRQLSVLRTLSSKSFLPPSTSSHQSLSFFFSIFDTCVSEEYWWSKSRAGLKPLQSIRCSSQRSGSSHCLHEWLTPPFVTQPWRDAFHPPFFPNSNICSISYWSGNLMQGILCHIWL
jgi:hypothetical protein